VFLGDLEKELDSCIYCLAAPDGAEHWLPRSLGKFRGDTRLRGRICKGCNERLGRLLDRELVRTGHTGLLRQVLGIHAAQQLLGHASQRTTDRYTLSAVPERLQFAVGQMNDVQQTRAKKVAVPGGSTRPVLVSDRTRCTRP
jgi:integrase